MKPQSLSILVPGGCPNDCACCCSKLHESLHTNDKNLDEELFRRDYLDAMRFAKDNDCNDLIFTGENGECLMNKSFMRMVVETNSKLPNPFIKNELQTSGCFLLQDDNLVWLRNFVRIKVISLSLFNIFNSADNSLYSRPKSKKAVVDIDETCRGIKNHKFTLRLSINMTNLYERQGITPEQIFNRAIELGANQVTFRVLYFIDDPKNEEERKINDWIIENKCSDEYMKLVREYILTHGSALEKLSFGAIRYSVNNKVSVVIDNNCMNKTDEENIKEDVKYLILLPSANICTKWDDLGSLIF